MIRGLAYPLLLRKLISPKAYVQVSNSQSMYFFLIMSPWPCGRRVCARIFLQLVNFFAILSHPGTHRVLLSKHRQRTCVTRYLDRHFRLHGFLALQSTYTNHISRINTCTYILVVIVCSPCTRFDN